MRVEINERVLQRNRRIAQYTFFASMAIWLSGLLITLMPLFAERTAAQYPWLQIIPSVILPIGLVVALFAVHMTNLWIREPRPEQSIRDGLKGVSSKSVLYHYHHTPAKHVLIAPQGLFIIVVRFQVGQYAVDEDRWRTFRSPLARLMGFFRLDGIGNPTDEAARAVEYIKNILDSLEIEAEVEPLIIFTDPRAEVEIGEVSVPVLYADEKQKPNLKTFMRDRKKQQGAKGSEMSLSPEQIEAFERATLPTTL